MSVDESFDLFLGIIAMISGCWFLWLMLKKLGGGLDNEPKGVKSAGMKYDEYNSKRQGWNRRIRVQALRILIGVIILIFSLLFLLHSDLNFIDDKPSELFLKLELSFWEIVEATLCGLALIVGLASFTRDGD